MEKFNLSGEWSVSYDGEKYDNKMMLPGTTEMNRICDRPNVTEEYEHFRRLYYVEGKIYYKRKIIIEDFFANTQLILIIERSKYTEIYIDGESISNSHECVVSQRHDIGKLSRGEHEIVIVVDNRLTSYEDFPPECMMGHQFTDHTQTNWNGIMGQFYIIRREDMSDDNVVLKDNISIIRNKIYDNGSVINLRGNVDCAAFLEEGVCPFDRESWLRIFKVYREYGLNHVRFHSWCPPKAAFEAADELNIYIQVEMSVFGAAVYRLGHGADSDRLYEYLRRQGSAILREYGNYRSFIIFAIGNELTGDIEAFEELVNELKKVRSDILITEGSNNFLEQPVYSSADDVFISMRTGVGRNIRGSYSHNDLPLGRLQINDKWATDWNYEDEVNDIDIPVIAHEVGQYQVSVHMQEIDNYNGALYPDAMIRYRDTLARQGRLHMADRYFKCSGKLAALLYKNEIEAFLRTESMAGFQLLGLNDFPGQGMALVGMLDSNYGSKGIITREEWREFCNDTVLLLEMNSYVYEQGENIKMNAYIYNYSQKDYSNFVCNIALYCDNTVIDKKEIEIVNGKRGLNSIGSTYFKTDELDIVKGKYTIHAKMGDISNHYDVFLYKKELPEYLGNEIKIVYREEDIDMDYVKNGGKVIFVKLDGLEGFYATDFWCYYMFRDICNKSGRHTAPGLMGAVIDSEHEIFRDFYTEEYATYQWQQIMVNSVVYEIESGDKVIVEVIDNFTRCKSLALLSERCIGRGRIIVSGCDFIKCMNIIEVRQLYNTIIRYLKRI